jgi:hypothetical protein
MTKISLFDTSGQLVTVIELPDPNVGIIVWRGRYFHQTAGRFVEATVYFGQ